MARRYVALLRGLNVGKARRVSMEDLRGIFEKLGYEDVRTLLASGNVVFTASDAAPKAVARIEKSLADRFGVVSRVTVLSEGELDAALEENPLAECSRDPSHFLVTVLADPAARKALLPLTKQPWKREKLALGPRVAYQACSPNLIDSPLAKAVARALGDGATSRNWSTMEKLRELLRAPSK